MDSFFDTCSKETSIALFSEWFRGGKGGLPLESKYLMIFLLHFFKALPIFEIKDSAVTPGDVITELRVAPQ
jgi:hypothetical protein